MGYFGSAGSLARVIFPILAGLLTDFYDDTVIFYVMACLLILSCSIYKYYLTQIIEIIED